MKYKNKYIQVACDGGAATGKSTGAKMISKKYKLKFLSSGLLYRYASYIIIKKGEHGALLFNGEKIFCAPALPLEEVFDPTGAGDSFIGGFAGYLSQCGRITFEEMKTATVMGSAMASFTVQKFGTESLEAITPERLKQRIQALKSLTKFEIELI